jgi:cobalamin biosynthesis protein CobT
LWRRGVAQIVVVVDDNVDVKPIENVTQDEGLQAVVIREVDKSCEPGALNDDFDEETFDEDDGNEDGTRDMDDISQGSEDDEVDVASADEDDFTSGLSTLDDV